MVCNTSTIAPETDERFGAELEAITETTIKPVVRRILRCTLNSNDRRTRNQDALELIGDIQVMIMAAVAARHDNGDSSIRDLRGYAAKTAANACYLYFRTNFPQRTRQENKLRYALKNMDGVSIWRGTDGRWLFAAADGGEATQLEPVPIDRAVSETWMAMETREGYLKAVRSVLAAARGPVLLDDLVNLMMEVLGIHEANLVSVDDGQLEDDGVLQIDDYTNALADQQDSNGHLKRVWKELAQMQLRDRKVILLNLKYEGGDLVKLLPLCGIASVHDIACALEFTDDEFAEVLGTLPWDDRRIGDHLGITRQKVINLRRNVRCRLFRILADEHNIMRRFAS